MIRAEIQRYGESIVGCNKLLMFVCRTAPIRSQFDHIFAIAEKEGWSLEFRPDGTVRFAPVQSRDGQADEREGRNIDVVEAAEEPMPRAAARALR